MSNAAWGQLIKKARRSSSVILSVLSTIPHSAVRAHHLRTHQASGKNAALLWQGHVGSVHFPSTSPVILFPAQGGGYYKTLLAKQTLVCISLLLPQLLESFHHPSKHIHPPHKRTFITHYPTQTHRHIHTYTYHTLAMTYASLSRGLNPNVCCRAPFMHSLQHLPRAISDLASVRLSRAYSSLSHASEAKDLVSNTWSDLTSTRCDRLPLHLSSHWEPRSTRTLNIMGVQCFCVL